MSKPTGPLHPLPVPNDCFDTVALDFIGPLLEEHGKDAILTMTDPLMIEVDTQGEVDQKETKAQLTTTAGVLDMQGFN